jgi:hypothetical protein
MLAQNVPLTVMAAALFLACARITPSQPLLREGDPPIDEQSEADAEALHPQELARRKAQLEEEQQLKLQEELMRIRGEQMQAEQEEIKRRDVMMRYALIIAIAVIATKLLIAFARSRVPVKDGTANQTSETNHRS